MPFKVGSKVRSKSGVFGKVTEIIKIEEGYQIVMPYNGAPGQYEPRVDLRVEYDAGDGTTGEILIHQTDAESV
jgi:hypothetical protein